MALACFLFDEHVPRALERGLRLRDPAIQIVVIGGELEAPALSTPDPDLLYWIAEHGCILVTNNRATILSRRFDQRWAAAQNLPPA